MTPSDSIGNVLLKGDLVMIQHGEVLMLGRIAEFKEPSVIAKPNPTQRQEPGFVVIDYMPISIPFDPRQVGRLGQVTKVVAPPHFTVASAKA